MTFTAAERKRFTRWLPSRRKSNPVRVVFEWQVCFGDTIEPELSILDACDAIEMSLLNCQDARAVKLVKATMGKRRVI